MTILAKNSRKVYRKKAWLIVFIFIKLYLLEFALYY